MILVAAIESLSAKTESAPETSVSERRQPGPDITNARRAARGSLASTASDAAGRAPGAGRARTLARASTARSAPRGLRATAARDALRRHRGRPSRSCTRPPSRETAGQNLRRSPADAADHSFVVIHRVARPPKNWIRPHPPAGVGWFVMDWSSGRRRRPPVRPRSRSPGHPLGRYPR